jgi:hypothetical protein
MITLNRKKNVINLIDVLSEDLAFRHNVDDLFRALHQSNFSEFLIDFSRIESISRSFAHQYLLMKKQSNLRIIERNIPPDIQRMFDYVKQTSPSLSQLK